MQSKQPTETPDTGPETPNDTEKTANIKCWRPKWVCWVWLIAIVSIGLSITSFFGTYHNKISWSIETTSLTIILAFVGILATFVVIGNYNQVKEIERKFDAKVLEIKEVRSRTENEIKEVKNYAATEINRVTSAVNKIIPQFERESNKALALMNHAFYRYLKKENNDAFGIINHGLCAILHAYRAEERGLCGDAINDVLKSIPREHTINSNEKANLLTIAGEIHNTSLRDIFDDLYSAILDLRVNDAPQQ